MEVAEVEVGIGRSARRAYGFDDIAIVPSRRTRDPEDVDISWEIDAFSLDLPLLATPSDAIVSPGTAVGMGELGGLGVLDLEGLWTRYEQPETVLEEITGLPADKATARMQELYAEPVKPELVAARIRAVKDAGLLTCAALRPQRAEALVKEVLAADLDLLVIRGSVVSAEHVSRNAEPLNLKRFIRELPIPVLVGGCASYQAALHLMRTGAAGVLVGVDGVPQATAIADAKGARMRHLDETGVYCQVVAAAGLRSGIDIAKAVVCGADAVMVGTPLAAAAEAPGRGWYWEVGATHPERPRGGRVEVGQVGSLEEILVGPARADDPRLNLFGSLRTAMATSGHETLKEFQKAEVVVLS